MRILYIYQIPLLQSTIADRPI